MASNTAALKERASEVAKAEPGTAIEARRPPTMLDLLKKQETEIAKALPKHVDATEFLRAAITVIKSNEKLLQCDPLTVLGGVMLAGQLGLVLGPLGHAYLVPFRNNRTGRMEAQFIIGYKGKLDLAWRSGRLLSHSAGVIREGDKWEYSVREDGIHFLHEPQLGDADRPAVAYYYRASLKDGGHHVQFVTPAEVERHRKRSKSKDNGPWVTDYEAMALKTAVHVATPWLPLSVEVANDLSRDEVVARGLTAEDLTIDTVTDVEEIADAEIVADPAGTAGDAEAGNASR